VSIVTLAILSVHRLMTVKGVPGWKIVTFQKSFGYEIYRRLTPFKCPSGVKTLGLFPYAERGSSVSQKACA
jgi:hypothetical protein